MIGRYSLPEMQAVFTDEARFEAWLEVELLAVEAWAAIGEIGAADAAVVRASAPKVNAEFVAQVSERERVTDHDVAAFVDVLGGKTAEVDMAAFGGMLPSWPHFPGAGHVRYRRFLPE